MVVLQERRGSGRSRLWTVKAQFMADAGILKLIYGGGPGKMVDVTLAMYKFEHKHGRGRRERFKRSDFMTMGVYVGLEAIGGCLRRTAGRG